MAIPKLASSEKQLKSTLRTIARIEHRLDNVTLTPFDYEALKRHRVFLQNRVERLRAEMEV